MREVRPCRFGSDAEFGLVDTDTRIVPASHYIRGATALNSFVGVDGHNATAEIRPRPSFNIRTHLLDLATAITAVRQQIPSYITMIAPPFHKNTTYGGHIHCSFFIRRLYKVPLIASFALALGYLLRPLEAESQPPDLRAKRNEYYGGGTDVRTQTSTSVVRCPPEYVYQHLEYRMPSSWLVHPALAFAYLSCAKLCMLNFQWCVAAYDKLCVVSVQKGEVLRRYQVLLEASDTIVTPDTRDLVSALSMIETSAESWFAQSPPGKIHTQAWKKILE